MQAPNSVHHRRFNIGGHGTQKLHIGTNILLQEAVHTDSETLILRPMISAQTKVKIKSKDGTGYFKAQLMIRI